jgi:hypothetical protein
MPAIRVCDPGDALDISRPGEADRTALSLIRRARNPQRSGMTDHLVGLRHPASPSPAGALAALAVAAKRPIRS